MAQETSMFSGVSLLDTRADENAAIRDNALETAKLARGRGSVYLAGQAGGLLVKNLAGMAGMQTTQEVKAETITNIMKETQSLDRNDPNSQKLIAQKFLAANMPEVAQKFLNRAREIEVENRTYSLEQERVRISQGQLTLAEKTEANLNIRDWERIGISKEQVSNQMYQFNERLGFDQSTLAYQGKQDSILNALRAEEMTLAQARFALSENAEQFKQAQGLVGNEQWKQAFDLDGWYKKAQVEIQWAGIDLSEQQLMNSKYEFNATLDFNKSTQEYQKTQDSILNALRNQEMTIAQADQALRANAESFKQTQTGVENDQWTKAHDLDNYIGRAQVAMGWAAHNLNDKKFDQMKYVDDKTISINDRAQNLAEDKQKFLESNQEILNKISEGSLEIDKGRLLLQQNSFEFDKSRKLVTDKQWLEKHTLEKDLADASIAHTKAQTEGKILENKAFPKNLELDRALTESQIIANTTKVVDSKLMVKNADDSGWHWATDADGDLLSDHNTALEFGMTADTKRLVDTVWKEYQRIYFTGGSMTEDARWIVPESLAFNAETNPTGLKAVPSFKQFAEMSVQNGGHGGNANVVNALQQAYGGEGSYQAELLKTTTLNRKPNEIVLQDSNGLSFAVPFSVEDLSKDLNIPVNILNKTAVYKDAKNVDNDSNAQILQEIKTMRDAYSPDSTEYAGYQTMLTDFVDGLNTTDVPAAAVASSTSGNLTAGGPATNEVTAADDVVNPNEKTTETQVDISPQRTKAAIAATGISAEEGSWKVKSGPWRKNMETMAKFKTVDGVHYVWSRDGAEQEKNQNVVDEKLDEFGNVILDWYR